MEVGDFDLRGIGIIVSSQQSGVKDVIVKSKLNDGLWKPGHLAVPVRRTKSDVQVKEPNMSSSELPDALFCRCFGSSTGKTSSRTATDNFIGSYSSRTDSQLKSGIESAAVDYDDSRKCKSRCLGVLCVGSTRRTRSYSWVGSGSNAITCAGRHHHSYLTQSDNNRVCEPIERTALMFGNGIGLGSRRNYGLFASSDSNVDEQKRFQHDSSWSYSDPLLNVSTIVTEKQRKEADPATLRVTTASSQPTMSQAKLNVSKVGTADAVLMNSA
ncbi:unnamed protein product [Soboliphyme baturini]|uniref:PDZ domain-containing protein n=1 Tax=Soboliphyme baturini TaxID=241478 RepID=A0A183J8F0_9BILA|nr:unnamed protein product [Soboliphyme baturini]